jgi:hypothetical protein
MDTPDLAPRIDALNDHLQRQLAASGGMWLLFDPILRPLEEDAPLAIDLGERERMSLPKLPGRPAAQPVMPWLAYVDSAIPRDSFLLRQSIADAIEELDPVRLNRGAGRRISGWLESAEDARAVAWHLSRTYIHDRQPGGRVLLRWTDPAVLWALWPILRADQQNSLLGPITVYRLLDPAGQWVELRPNPEAATPERLHITPEQWPTIEDITPFNAALRATDILLLRPALAARRDDTLAALARARHLGFEDRNDCTAFARCALTVHRAFDSHPQVAERLARRRPDDYFTALIDDLTPEHWAHIRTELGG